MSNTTDNRDNVTTALAALEFSDPMPGATSFHADYTHPSGNVTVEHDVCPWGPQVTVSRVAEEDADGDRIGGWSVKLYGAVPVSVLSATVLSALL